MIRTLRRAVLSLALSVVGCAHAPPPAPHAAQPLPAVDDVRTWLTTQRDARVRMAGVIKARLPGPGGAFVAADLDVAAEAPDRLAIAVRSFFDAPTQMLVADGAQVTVYDATSGMPVFLRGPPDERAAARVLGLPVSPRNAVALVLGIASLDKDTRVIVDDADDAAGTVRVSLEAPGGAREELVVMRGSGEIVERTLFRGSGEPLLHVRARETVRVGGVLFARRLDVELLAQTASGTRGAAADGVVLDAVDVVWNGPPLPPDAFVLPVPDGVQALPLDDVAR